MIHVHCPFFITLTERSDVSMREKYYILTNNPMVAEKLSEGHNVVYMELSYEEILKEVRNRIHGGQSLLSHPLSGSVKPNETPYKSVLVGEAKPTAEELAFGLELIENAIGACEKFRLRPDRFGPKVLDDFKLIDYTLIKSAVESADMGI